MPKLVCHVARLASVWREELLNQERILTVFCNTHTAGWRHNLVAQCLLTYRQLWIWAPTQRISKCTALPVASVWWNFRFCKHVNSVANEQYSAFEVMQVESETSDSKGHPSCMCVMREMNNKQWDRWTNWKSSDSTCSKKYAGKDKMWGACWFLN